MDRAPRFFSRHFRAGLCVAGVLLSAFAPHSLRGQAAGGQDRAELLQNQNQFQSGRNVSPEGEDNGQAAESPNDSDLGAQEILKRAERYQPFTAEFAVPFYYTSNVALARAGEKGDFIELPEISFTYAPRITRTLYADVTVQQSLFYYDRFSALDFGSFDARAGLVYFLPQLHNLSLRASYDFNRLTFKDSFDDFYSQLSLCFNGELPFRFGRAQQIALGASANLLLDGTPERAGRHEFNIYAGYAISLTRALSVTAAGRTFVRDYVVGSRVDVSEVLALTANYRFNKYVTGSFVSELARSDSNQSVFDYSVANAGGALALTIKF